MRVSCLGNVLAQGQWGAGCRTRGDPLLIKQKKNGIMGRCAGVLLASLQDICKCLAFCWRVLCGGGEESRRG